MRGSLLWSGLCLLPEIVTATNYGTFADPANNARMKFRYWLPDAGVDIPTVQRDIEAAGELGAGAVEFLPLYNYGGSLAGPPQGADWATYGFGTPAFNKVFKASLQTANKAGMRMDFALGPNQGQGVPAHTTDRGLHWDLVSVLQQSGLSPRYLYSARHLSIRVSLPVGSSRVGFPDGELVSWSLWYPPGSSPHLPSRILQAAFSRHRLITQREWFLLPTLWSTKHREFKPMARSLCH